MRRLLGLIALFFLCNDAAAQTASPSSVTQDHGIILGTPISSEAFARETDGRIRHLQSGARCPSGFPNAAFIRTMIFPAAATGWDVACDYGRFGPNGATAAKLTVFFVKAPADASLDALFAQYQQEILATRKRFRGR